MADEPSTELVRELRLIRLALYLLAFLMAVMFFSDAMDRWVRSQSPPETISVELRSIQGQLQAISQELNALRTRPAPPVVLPQLPPKKGDADK